MILAGFITVLVASLLLLFKALRERRGVRGGGMVMIGPFPVVLGTDRESVKVLLLLSLALTVLALILMVFSYYTW